MTDSRVFGDVATKLLFENDRVKVWELDLEPGETSDLHEHHHDYLLIQLEGDKIAGIFEEDTRGEYLPGVVEATSRTATSSTRPKAESRPRRTPGRSTTARSSSSSKTDSG